LLPNKIHRGWPWPKKKGHRIVHDLEPRDSWFGWAELSLESRRLLGCASQLVGD
jgi:hypothetical protein